MAKLNTEKLLSQISELPIDEQIELAKLVTKQVQENVDAHQLKLLNEASKYSQITGTKFEKAKLTPDEIDNHRWSLP